MCALTNACPVGQFVLSARQIFAKQPKWLVLGQNALQADPIGQNVLLGQDSQF